MVVEDNTATSSTSTKAKKEASSSFGRDLADFESMAKRYRVAPGKEACAKIKAENPDLFKAGILRGRQAEREVLPFITAGLNRAEETTVGSVGIGLAMLGGLGFAGTVIYKGGAWVWNYFRPV